MREALECLFWRKVKMKLYSNCRMPELKEQDLMAYYPKCHEWYVYTINAANKFLFCILLTKTIRAFKV